jgi:hypothetical protein
LCRAFFTFLYFLALHFFVLFYLPFSVLLLFVSGRLRIWRGVVEDPWSSLVLFKDSFKDPRYCSLGFLETLVKRPSGRI